MTGVSPSPLSRPPWERAPPLPPIPTHPHPSPRFPRVFFGCAVVGGVGAGRGGFWVVPGGVPGVTPWGTRSSTPDPTRKVTHSLTQGATQRVTPGPMPRGTPSITPESYGWVRYA